MSKPVAIGIICKTPVAGKSKTRLCPPLSPEECAAISACFIADLARTIHSLVQDSAIAPYALYTPIGSEAVLRCLLPPSFTLVPQVEGDLGIRLLHGLGGFLDIGHQGAILINSDSPTLPPAILTEAVEMVLRGHVVLSPAVDGGYTLVGLPTLHRRLFEDITWSTSHVYRQTLERAREVGVAITNVPMWYDIDDAASLAMLEAELARGTPPFSDIPGADASATRGFLAERQRNIARAAA